MGKVSKMMLVLVLSALLLMAVAGPAAAARDAYDAMACWNNCGIGGTVTQ